MIKLVQRVIMVTEDLTKDKVSSLYKYLKQFCLLRCKVITDVSKQRACFYFNEFPNAPEWITINYRDRLENVPEEEIFSKPILTIKKPEFQTCPDPPEKLKVYLTSNWDLFINEVALNENFLKLDEVAAKPFQEAFSKWLIRRSLWVEKQKTIKQVRDLFNDLRKIEASLQKEDDSIELVVGNGFLTSNTDKAIKHPLLFKRVSISYDAINNSISITDVERESELYLDLVRIIKNVNIDAIRGLQEELHENFYHPLDRNDTQDFFKTLIHKLHNNGIFDEGQEINILPNEEVLKISFVPMLILRKRNDGALKALDSIVDNIENEGDIPPYLIDLTNGGKLEVKEDIQSITIDEQLAATSGEDPDILLPLEANKEQLEIAQRIEKFNAVIVQGPPGTGKSHSIANILSHFLAQGKNVLIASHTKKALSVLKDKIPKELQSLCVSLLDDSNIDMERSIDGIANYLSRYTSRELFEKAKQLEHERNLIIADLADLRRKIFAVRNKELKRIDYEGKAYSVIEVADYVSSNEDVLANIIPGDIEVDTSFPLTDFELSELYLSNSELSVDDESEIRFNIPNPADLLSPAEFNDLKTKYENILFQVKNISKYLSLNLKIYSNKIVSCENGAEKILVTNISQQTIKNFTDKIRKLEKFEDWMLQAICDGMSHKRGHWIQLIEKIEKAVAFTKNCSSKNFGKKVIISESVDIDTAIQVLTELQEFLSKNKKLSMLDYLFHPNFKKIVSLITINNKQIAKCDDCIIALNELRMRKQRKDISTYWNLLFAVNGQCKFIDLGDEPEIQAEKYIPKIKYYLDWYNNEYEVLVSDMRKNGFNSEYIISSNDLATNKEQVLQAIDFISNKLGKYIKLGECIQVFGQIIQKYKACINILTKDNRKQSDICISTIKCVKNFDCVKYEKCYSSIAALYSKIELANHRNQFLSKIEKVAPVWAFEIKNRIGIHGECKPPNKVKEAWKWKQFSMQIDDIMSESLDDKIKKAVDLSKYLKQKTVELAEAKAWYHLLKRSEADIDLKQALNGWKLTLKQIGKGTGKNAKKYRQEARNKMKKCQQAVPAWIMTINTALENLTPGENIFDVIIIDEASQSDISALAVCYMGKRLIIVGDDKQVSPSSIGIEIEQTNNLLTTYLKDKIPNWHLFNPQSSLYDIAGTTFQPLMLREHFRCVPDIIGYSNKLSYNGKIKPLREARSSNLLPAVINYHVDSGNRDVSNKINEAEADAIVSLIQACIEQPEYADKTFGVISLLGEEQAVLIQNKIYEKIDILEYGKRKILCGNASNFQGDERDVIFLSMVDSNNDNVPLKLKGFGGNDSIRQRYNVAASRAKDQMWVVHSLDVVNDLKDGDIRKGLLEYSLNPNSYTNLIEQARNNSESPFEQEVYEYLVANDFNIIQQWPVGSYRIDMVVLDNENKIAIECDGTRFHSGEEKVRQDMERQTILERVGWKFIRIRGSEYYRNKDKTMKSVICKLRDLGVKSGQTIINKHELQYTELQERVIRVAHNIQKSWKEELNSNVVL